MFGGGCVYMDVVIWVEAFWAGKVWRGGDTPEARFWISINHYLKYAGPALLVLLNRI